VRCPHLEACFENLKESDYDHDRVSPQTEDYNCIAWAAGDSQKPWWPAKDLRYFWPAHLPREDYLQETLENFLRAFECLGYSRCRSSKLEQGVQKVAIFVGPANNPLHAARQLESGMWVSKCGDLEDIEHKTLSSMEGRHYGKAVAFLRRRVDGRTFFRDRFMRFLRKAFGLAKGSQPPRDVT